LESYGEIVKDCFGDETMKEAEFFIETIAITIVGGGLFYLFTLPLPWMLGPLTGVMIWKGLTDRLLVWPNYFKNSGLILLGMSFGINFTIETIQIDL